jgi:hypothetical protein
MHYLEKCNPIQTWLLSMAALVMFILLPGSPFEISVFLPIIFCKIIPSKRIEIVLCYTLIFGIFFSSHLFSFHLFGFNSTNAIHNVFQGRNVTGLFEHFDTVGRVLGLVLYFIFFALLFLGFNFFFRTITFAASILLPVIIMIMFFVSEKFLSNNYVWSYAFSLAMLIFSHSVFYLFNYIRFFDKLPASKKEFFATIQPFWFFLFETPENPIIPADKNKAEQNLYLKDTLNILISSMIFKIMLTLFLTVACFILTRHWALIVNDGMLVNDILFPYFQNWREVHGLLLLLALFCMGISYLGSSFFIYGRVVVSIARLCGFHLPDYINEPWKSKSFADFFSRLMYYYNVIIINNFFYPVLDFSRRFKMEKKLRIFLCLNWALIFGGFFSRFLKDIGKVYEIGFFPALMRTALMPLPYLVLLSLAISFSYFNQNKKPAKVDLPRMIFYILVYSLIMSLNYSRAFGNLTDILHFYKKVLTLGILT